MCLLNAAILMSAPSPLTPVFFQRCVNGFPARRLLWADPTSKASSLTLLSAWLPYPFLWEQLWISQVPATTLYTCHGLITPLVRCNLAEKKNGCFAWTSTALQASSTRIRYFRSDTNTSGPRQPLWPIQFSVYASPILFAANNIQLRQRRNTRYGWPAKPYPTRTFTLQVVTSFLVALTPAVAAWVNWRLFCCAARKR